MKKIKTAIVEIEKSLRRLDVFLILIKTLVILMVSYLLLFIINIEPYLSLVPAAVYLLSSVLTQSRIDRLRQVERRYHPLNEKLRTARDNVYKENPVVDNLEEEIIGGLKDVRLSKFFPFGIALLLSALLIFSVAASLFISSQNLKVIKLDDLMNNAVKRLQNNTDEEEKQEDFTNGKESMMKVGNERVKVEINPVGIDFDFTKEGEQASYDFGTSFPKDIFISSGAAYESDLSEEQQALVKRYFEKKRNT